MYIYANCCYFGVLEIIEKSAGKSNAAIKFLNLQNSQEIA